MTSKPGTDKRYQNCLTIFRARGQDHVLRWWDGLASGERERLLDDLESIPWDVLDKLIPSHVLSKPNTASAGDLQPAPVYPPTPGPDQQTLYEEAFRMGRERLAGGFRVCRLH